MPTEQGYSNQKKKGTAQFKTIHNVGSDSFGTISIQKSAYDISLADQAIVSVSDVIGNDGLVKYWNIEITAHGATEGQILRIVSGSLKNFEFEIISIVDADNLYVLPTASNKPTGENARVFGWVTSQSDASGMPIVSQGPVQFKLDTVNTEVSKDSAVPANTVALPVEDYEARQSLASLDLKDFATAAKQDLLLTELQLKADLTETQPVSLASIPLASGASTEAKQDTGNTSLSSIDGKIIEDGTIITSNSSTTPLGSNAVFTGSAFEVTKYSAINVGVYSDVASATNGVKVEFSPDGTNWDHSHSTTYSAVSGIGYIFNCEYKYARVVYTNGTSAQGSFRLQTIVKKNFTGPSLYTIDQSVSGNMFASLGKNLIIGKSTAGGGTFVDVKVNPSGALTVEASLSAGTNNIGDVDVASLPVSFNTGAADATTQRVVIASSQTVPVSAASLPLPTGAATDAKLDTIITTIGSTNTKLDSIETNTSPELNSHSTQAVTSASAVTFTAPSGAKRMVIQNSLAAGGAIRFVASANTPTSSSGFYLGVGQSTSEIAAGSFKAIATTASEDGDVTVIWFV